MAAAGPVVVLVDGRESGPASTVQLIELNHRCRCEDLLLVEVAKLLLRLPVEEHAVVDAKQDALMLSHGPDVDGPQVLPTAQERLHSETRARSQSL